MTMDVRQLIDLLIRQMNQSKGKLVEKQGRKVNGSKVEKRRAYLLRWLDCLKYRKYFRREKVWGMYY